MSVAEDITSGNGTTDQVSDEPDPFAEAPTPPEAADRPAVEVIDRAEPGTEVAVVSERNTALERAAEAALAMPGLPGRDEFLMLAVQARMLSMSQGAPKEVRNNPHLAFHVAMIGRDLGISPSAALQQVDVIGEGDDAQLSLSPELLNGQVRRLGLGSIVPGFRSYERAVAVALAPDGHLDPRCGVTLPDTHWADAENPEARCHCRGVLGATDFTWVDAQIAGLATWDCASATNHSDACKQRQKYKACRQGWRTYPKRMLWWRAAGYCSADYFPEASIGLYSPEELGAVVDENGRPIDPATIELPEGYEPAIEPPSPGEIPWAESDPDGYAEVAARIARIATVPDAELALRGLWRPEGGDMKAPPLAKCLRKHAATVKALVRSIEVRGEKGEFGDWPELAADDPAPSDAAQEPAAAAAPDAAPEPEGPAACATCGAAPDGDHDATKHDVALAQQVVAEVKAMSRVDVIAALEADGWKVARGEERQRADLATVLYLTRGGTPDPTRPGPERSAVTESPEAATTEQPELA